MNFLPFYSNIPDNEQISILAKLSRVGKWQYQCFLTRLQAFFADILPYELNDQMSGITRLFSSDIQTHGTVHTSRVRSAKDGLMRLSKPPEVYLCIRIQTKWHSRASITANRR